jgi:hypothetical protein
MIAALKLVFGLIGVAIWSAAEPSLAANLAGTLRLTDASPSSASVEYLDVAVRSLDRATVIRARPDKTGRFILANMLPGRYTFDFPFGGRFISVLLGGRPVILPDFDLKSSDVGLLEIVVSIKGSALSADILGLPKKHGPIAAVLSPEDPQLTLRYSCYVNSVDGAYTEFRYVPSGIYRLFVVDESLKGEVSAYAPRFPGFLKTRSPKIVVGGVTETVLTTTYISATIVEEAVHLAGPLVR